MQQFFTTTKKGQRTNNLKIYSEINKKKVLLNRYLQVSDIQRFLAASKIYWSGERFSSNKFL